MNLNLLDWVIVAVPLFAVLYMAFYARRYARDVADFLVAGRVAGRYVISVAGMESAMGIITMVGYIESHYQTGFAITFWNNLLLPVSMILSLAGYCVYRFRETKALSLGQFLEMRYSRSFRFFATGLRTFSEMLTNIICPALAARFFIYLIGLPLKVTIFGCEFSTFSVLMLTLLIISAAIPLVGGMVSLIITDCLQGLFCYPIFVIMVIFIITEFSWFGEVAPTMLDRAANESFLNPYDISGLRDFNLFALMVSLTSTIINRANWYGGGASSCGRTPHEQKMASVLGTWRGGLSLIMQILIAICIITAMNHADFADKARDIRIALSDRVSEELIANKEIRSKLMTEIKKLPVQRHKIGVDKPLSRKENLDTPYMNVALKTLRENIQDQGEANSLFQQFNTLYHQTMLPTAMSKILPAGLVGVFVLLGMMLMISTDDSRIFSSASTIVQDLIVPFFKNPPSLKTQLFMIRCSVILVSVVFFFGALFLSQLDYVNLFVNICVSIWSGGAGSVMTFGLYSRFGTTAGAYASLLTGALFSGGGILVQRNWADVIYPWLDRIGYAEAFGNFLTLVSRPFNPYIVWEMNPVKFPINSMELYMMAMLFSMMMYCLVSFITCRKPFNLDRMLYRGKYNIEGIDKNIHMDWSFKTVFKKIVGITPDYSFGDRIIAWSVFGYVIVYQFFILFIGTVIFNTIYRWPKEWWGYYFFISLLLVPGIAGAITTVWFFIGGVRDLRQLFIDLHRRKISALDNGRVSGNISDVDREALLAKDAQK